MISAPKSHETTWLWLAKVLSGVLVLVILIVHLVVNHLVAKGGLLTFQEVVVYLSNPWIAFMEGSFLVIAVAHALLGMRGIIIDLRPTARILRVVDGAFTLLGVVAISYGIWLLRTIITNGM